MVAMEEEKFWFSQAENAFGFELSTLGCRKASYRRFIADTHYCVVTET